MVSIEKILVYLILALGVVIFLKLDRRMSILSRLFVSIAAVLLLLLLLMLISTIITVVVILLLVGFLLYFLERGRNKVFGRKRG